MSEKPGAKERKHKILGIPVLGPILIIVWGYLFAVVVGGIPAAVIDRCGTGNGTYLTIAVFVLLALLIHRRWFRPEFRC